MREQAYTDIFVTTFFDETARRVRVKPLPGQAVPDTLLVKCSHKARKQFPVGTIFRLDVYLKRSKKGFFFLIARSGAMPRAIEYFDHNLQLQKSYDGNVN